MAGLPGLSFNAVLQFYFNGAAMSVTASCPDRLMDIADSAERLGPGGRRTYSDARQVPSARSGLPMLRDFDEWITEEFERGAFTALILVLDVGEETAEPVASTYLHVIGDDIDWRAMRTLLDGAPQSWNAAAFFVSRSEKGGPVSDRLAKIRLTDIGDKVKADRLALNTGAFFNRDGRRMLIEEAGPTRH
jgi:hypothetical protein